jgi:hypothetical protein
MAVLAEAISVMVRVEAIRVKVNGGWAGFVAQVANDTLCTDNELARVGFMHPNDAIAFVKNLVAGGLTFLDSAQCAVDIAVVDQQTGPTTCCLWIDFLRVGIPGGTVSAARLKGSSDGRLFCPPGWNFQNSLSRNFQFHPGTQADTHLRFLRHEGRVDVFLDQRTGKEMYVGRPAVRPDVAGE